MVEAVVDAGALFTHLLYRKSYRIDLRTADYRDILSGWRVMGKQSGRKTGRRVSGNRTFSVQVPMNRSGRVEQVCEDTEYV